MILGPFAAGESRLPYNRLWRALRGTGALAAIVKEPALIVALRRETDDYTNRGAGQDEKRRIYLEFEEGYRCSQCYRDSNRVHDR